MLTYAVAGYEEKMVRYGQVLEGMKKGYTAIFVTNVDRDEEAARRLAARWEAYLVCAQAWASGVELNFWTVYQTAVLQPGLAFHDLGVPVPVLWSYREGLPLLVGATSLIVGSEAWLDAEDREGWLQDMEGVASYRGAQFIQM